MKFAREDGEEHLARHFDRVTREDIDGRLEFADRNEVEEWLAGAPGPLAVAFGAALSFAGHWVSGGKWSLRELRDLDPDLATRWLAARDAPAELTEEVLAAGGGPLFDGYRA